MPFIAPKSDNPAKIKVVGVGGGGQNAINTMVKGGDTYGVDFIAMNTDLQALSSCAASSKLQLGPQRTHGLGSGADPQVGQEAALESVEEIRKLVEGSDMIFITAGLGGGTGTGASPVVAQIAHEMGVLTVGVVTKPFDFEGKRRLSQSENGIKELKSRVDALIVIPNQKLLEVVEEKTSMQDAFKIVDKVVGNAVKGISDLITAPGLINVDFADVKSVMSNAGSALMGIGFASGENRAEKAAKMAINSPLLGVDIKGSTGILLNIVGDSSLTMHEVNIAAKIVSESASENANIIFGANIDPSVEGVQVTVIATGFDTDFKSVSVPSTSSGISDRDIIEQIDSRFDSIKIKSPRENIIKEIRDEPIDEDEPKGVTRVGLESFGGNSDETSREFSFDNLRQEVKEMEEREKEVIKKPTKDGDPLKGDQSDDDKSGGFWSFIGRK